MGSASFSTAPLQVAATGQFTRLANTFGGSIAYGTSSSVFGAAGASTTANDGDAAHRLSLSARAGYQLELGSARRIQACPNAGFVLGIGPNDAGSGVERSSRVGIIGVNVGAIFPAGPRMNVVPTAGIAFGFATEKAENDAGATLFEIDDKYALAQVGVGILLDANLSLRPNVEFPLGLDGGEPVLGLTVGYNFGH
jgi:hypothetical protein